MRTERHHRVWLHEYHSVGAGGLIQHQVKSIRLNLSEPVQGIGSDAALSLVGLSPITGGPVKYPCQTSGGGNTGRRCQAESASLGGEDEVT